MPAPQDVSREKRLWENCGKTVGKYSGDGGNGAGDCAVSAPGEPRLREIAGVGDESHISVMNY